MDRAFQDRPGKLVDQLALDEPLDGTCAIDRVVAVLYHAVLERLGVREFHAFLLQFFLQDGHLDAHDLADVVRGDVRKTEEEYKKEII